MANKAAESGRHSQDLQVMMISPDSYDFVSATGFFRRFEEVTIYGDLVRELGLEHIQGLN